MSNLKHIQRIRNEYEVSTFNLNFLFTPLIENELYLAYCTLMVMVLPFCLFK